MPPAHCGVAYLAYRTLLPNGAIYSQAVGDAGIFKGAQLAEKSEGYLHPPRELVWSGVVGLGMLSCVHFQFCIIL